MNIHSRPTTAAKARKRPQEKFRSEKLTEQEVLRPSIYPLLKRQKPLHYRSCLVVKCDEVMAFFRLFDEDTLVQDFLFHDVCFRVSDRYLLAMVFTYFKRAHLALSEYTRYNFFLALYLASDMEEDEEDFKYEIFPWILGDHWRDTFPKFLIRKDQLWSRMHFRAAVSKKCCDEGLASNQKPASERIRMSPFQGAPCTSVMQIRSDHYIWKRERSQHHGGAVRNCHKTQAEREPLPRGPGTSPIPCKRCARVFLSSGYISCESELSDDEASDSFAFSTTSSDESPCDAQDVDFPMDAVEQQSCVDNDGMIGDSSFDMGDFWDTLS